MLDLRKIGGVLQTGCDFPQRYARFENERWPEEGDALQTGGVRITARIRYVVYNGHDLLTGQSCVTHVSTAYMETCEEGPPLTLVHMVCEERYTSLCQSVEF